MVIDTPSTQEAIEMPAENRNDPFVRVDNLIKTYKTNAGAVNALQGIDLTIYPGEFVAILGKSGAGKSTLVNVLAGIDRPSDGQVWVEQTPVHTLNEGQAAKWRSLNVGVVFQQFKLMPLLSCVENVMLPMDFANRFSGQKGRRERAMALLDDVELANHAFKRPSAVSGGQRQRVAIARALANDPQFIVADEPTGNLDSQTAESVFQLFKRLVAQGKTMVMVTHDRDLAARVDRTITLADGRII